MSDFIDETIYQGKPYLKWIEPYQRSDGTDVTGHLRTSPNETTADNLSTDVDGDGIPGFFDADADGDGVLEALDIDGDGIADGMEEAFNSLLTFFTGS